MKYKELKTLFEALSPLDAWRSNRDKIVRKASLKRKFSVRLSKANLLCACRALAIVVELLHRTPEHKRKFRRLLKAANACLLNPDHPDWQPGTQRLLEELLRRKNA